MSTEPDPEPLTAEDEDVLRRAVHNGANGETIGRGLSYGEAVPRLLASLDAAREVVRHIAEVHAITLHAMDEAEAAALTTPSSVTPDLRAALERLDAIARVEPRNAIGDAEFDDALAQSFTALHPGVRPVWKSALASVTPSEPTLDAAWKEAEAALPEGWRPLALDPLEHPISAHDDRTDTEWVATTVSRAWWEGENDNDAEHIEGTGPTPAAALVDLSVILRAVQHER